ncbi:hypothetical protein K523DRAFT_255931, partial [Schizophyllum commune Tattone D]
VPFGVTYEKFGTIQRRLAWPLHKDDTLFRSGRPTGLNIYCFVNLWMTFAGIFEVLYLAFDARDWHHDHEVSEGFSHPSESDPSSER